MTTQAPNEVTNTLDNEERAEFQTKIDLYKD